MKKRDGVFCNFNLFKNKKAQEGSDLVNENVIFIVLNAVFFIALFAFVYRAGSGISTYEQFYAKQIALFIDAAKPGDKIKIDISELFVIMEKNKIKGQPITIDNDKKEVFVKIAEGKGYSYKYFSDLKVAWGSSDKRGFSLEFQK